MPNPLAHYDVIVIGAGSIGAPAAFYLANSGLKTLVLDKYPSVGQGSSKRAIGGIRATHSDPAKIKICLNSIQIFSTWKEKYGEDIDWQKDYSLPSEEQDVEEYHHKDVFLGTINGAYGTPLFSGDAPQDEFFENHYSYEIPENIDIIGNSAGEETGLSIIAYLMDNASYEIIQVTEVAVPITY